MKTSPRCIPPVSALAAGALLALALPIEAQEAPPCSYTAEGEELTGRASPPDSASAELAGDVVKVCFSSPRMRGREIMGGLVPYDQPWRLGANEPTTLHLTGPARVGDVSLDPGSYVLYAIPGETSWELVVNGAADRWGVPIDDEVREHDIGSVTVTPEETAEAVEALDLRFEPGEGDGLDLVVEWERTRLSVPIRAEERGDY